MNELVAILPAGEEHLEAAADIAVEAWTPIRGIFRRDLGGELYEAFFSGWEERKRSDVIRELTAGRGYVAVLNGRVVGFISYFADEGRKIGIIGTNAVDKSCRGKGIGQALYRFIQDRMRSEGLLFAQVTTGGDDGHAPARRAYERAGFERSLPSVCYYKKL